MRQKRGVFYALLVGLSFGALILLGLGGIWLFHRNGDFYSAFQSGLRPAFYLSAGSLLLFGSVLYTPFSYGISYYFLLAAEGRARFRAIFFLFCRPRLLTRAAVLAILKKGMIYLERLALLLLAALVEVFLFLTFLLLKGEDLFSLRQDPFVLAADFMLRHPPLMVLSILLWGGVLLGMVLIYLRHILCKYVLLCVPAVGILQALKVGRLAIRGHLWKTLFFYLRYGAIVLLWGRGGAEPFSVYARRLALQGWQIYCRRRSLR